MLLILLTVKKSKFTAFPMKGYCCKPCVMPGFITSGEADFDPGAETSLDDVEILYSKVLLKYERDRESFFYGHQKKTERVLP